MDIYERFYLDNSSKPGYIGYTIQRVSNILVAVMTKQLSNSEQHNLSSPTDTETEIRARILNTQIGIVDTPEELDAQLHNLGPKDTSIEANDDEGPSPNKPKLG